MTPDLNHTTLIERIIHMRLHLSVNGDSAMDKNGFGLVATDAVKGLHNKIEQLAGLLHLTHDGFVIVARHSVVVMSSHFSNNSE